MNTITDNSKRIGEQMIETAKKTSESIINDAGDRAAAELRQTRNTIVSSFVNKIVDETRTKLKKDVDDAKRGEYIDEYSKLSKTQRGVQ